MSGRVCVLGVSVLPILRFLVFDYRIAPTVWYIDFALYKDINASHGLMNIQVYITKQTKKWAIMYVCFFLRILY